MGFSPCVIDEVIKITKELNNIKSTKENLNVLTTGYPDILRSIEEFPFKGLEVRSDSEDIAKYHGKDPNRLRVPTAESFFKTLGFDLDVLDIKEIRGGELIFDLNWGLNDQINLGSPIRTRKYDLIVENGSLEHCFNFSQGLQTLASLVKKDGYIILWNPFFMPNHGFISVNPTFYCDFFEANGFEVIQQKLWNKERDGQELPYEVPKYKRFNFTCTNASLLTTVKKIKEVSGFEYPIQTKYKTLLGLK